MLPAPSSARAHLLMVLGGPALLRAALKHTADPA